MRKVPREWLDQLIDFENGGRFRWAGVKCPLCGQEALADEWPPNYCGCAMRINYEKGTSSIREWGALKCVCVPCRVAFSIHWEESRQDVKYSETVPLVEKNGKLLTPFDAWCEEYKEEHGEYPVLAFA